jgi:SAM-dependent methyltransferase
VRRGEREGLLHRVVRRTLRLVPPAPFRNLRTRLRARRGLEIGGPSALFERWNLWPVYPVVASLDNYNLAAKTLWQDHSGTPGVFQYDRRRRRGREFVGDAADMAHLSANGYEFILASHVVEHIANPLRALSHWTRLVVEGGLLILVVPHRDGTFDHRREITSLQHLFDDFARNTPETDETHVDEVLRMHDLRRDPDLGGPDEFLRRVKANATLRSIHHHVFDTDLALRMLLAAGLEIVYVDVQEPHHICLAGEVTARSKTAKNWAAPAASLADSAWLRSEAPWRRSSPFPTDRILKA